MIATIQSQQSLARAAARELRILEVESWFHVLKTRAEARGLWVKLENRYQKSAHVYECQSGVKLGRIWVNYLGVVCYDLKSWVSHFEEVPTLEAALNSLADRAIDF